MQLGGLPGDSRAQLGLPNGPWHQLTECEKRGLKEDVMYNKIKFDLVVGNLLKTTAISSL